MECRGNVLCPGYTLEHFQKGHPHDTQLVGTVDSSLIDNNILTMVLL